MDKNLDKEYMSSEEISKDLPDIFVCHWLESYIVPEDAGYTKKIFDANISLKGKLYIDNIMYVYVREE